MQKLYSLLQNKVLTQERVEADSSELNKYTLINIEFSSTSTGQVRSFQLLGPYRLCYGDGEYYYARIQNGEEIYDAFCAVMQELTEKDKSRR